MKKIFLVTLFTLITTIIFSQIGPASTPSPYSSMVQNPSLGITTWRTILPNPIYDVIIAKGTESYTHNVHSFIYPNYALPRADTGIQRLMFIDSLGRVKVSSKFPFDNRYLKSYTETDPVWLGVSVNYRTKAQNDLLYYPLSGNPSGFLTTFMEVDPTVPSYAKTLGSFGTIKSSTDALYQPLGNYLTGIDTTNLSLRINSKLNKNDTTTLSNRINTKLGKIDTVTLSDRINLKLSITTATSTYYPLSNPAGYISSVPAQSWASLTGKPTTLSGYGITDAVPSNRQLTINGITQDLSVNRTFSIPATDTNSLSTRINLKLNKSDTTSLSNRINDKQGQLSGSGLVKISGTSVSYDNSVYLVSEVDGSVTNEMQSLSITGNNLSISGGNTVSIPSSTYTAGTGISIVSNVISRSKRQETYSGVTNASGIYTVTFGTAYSVAPNIQANIINGADNQNIRITAISTTGFTVLVRNRVDVIGLLPTWNNASGMGVDVLITEK